MSDITRERGDLEQPPLAEFYRIMGPSSHWFLALWTVVDRLLKAVGISAVGSVQTTDATKTTCVELEIPEGKSSFIIGKLAVAEDDLSNPGYYTLMAYATRTSGGNASVTGRTVGAAVGCCEEPNSSCDADIEATSPASGSVRLTVTGIAATTYDWRGVLTAIPNLD